MVFAMRIFYVDENFFIFCWVLHWILYIERIGKMDNKSLKQTQVENESELFINETPEQTAQRNKEAFVFSNNKAIRSIEKYFKFDTLGAIMKKEIIGGITTFLSLMYILTVNPGLVSGTPSINTGAGNMNYFGIFFATALVSGICCIIMGLFANIPVAMSTSMGMNALVSVNIGISGGLGFEGAMIVTMLSSVVFVTVSLTPLRSFIIKSIPKGIVLAIGIGIGLFIAYVGISSMGWLAQENGIPMASVATLKDNYLPIILGSITLLLILFLAFKKIPGAVAIAILSMSVIAIILASTLPSDSKAISLLGSADLRKWEGWNYDFDGFAWNWTSTFKAFGNAKIWTSPVTYISIFVVMLINFFDATGTMAAFTHQLDQKTNQHKEISQKALVIDSMGTMMASVTGTTPLGVFAESAAGIEQGAKTGLAAVVNGILFLLAIIMFPIFKLIPQPITSAACVYIGIMMIKEAAHVEWDKPEFLVPTFLSILFMIATYEIANGVAMAFIGYSFMMMITGKAKKVHPAVYCLSVLFVIYFIAFAFIQVK
ncbi:Xanthine uracil thiamine ascorbate permease family protein [Mesoplasma florum W37]|uniref:Xanthine uracil thiamine ascorbate permease family protein n=2 Tax=Mesoplasma florum TaxID=2151 RepID=A0AAD0MP19_MESFO|nr:Xanthine uracil thiamine ascorbate permease family protein [Mesoplasma florum W37]AVN65844.1 Xanthine uracil thiamine ascorbate permease family protein [Mesoplasma florum]